jgi:hypothetical protein
MSKKENNLNKNNFLKKIYIVTSYLFLGVFSFYINYWTGSRGVFPVDTFVHFDSGIRILQGELPLRDFWVVHGVVVDFIQSLFFLIFGENWKAYIFHSSFLNLIITIFSYRIFKKELKIENKYALILSICLSILFFPVSGTPFLDIHSAFFSTISVYLIFLFIKYQKNLYLFLGIFSLGLAFFSKQVPAAYFIILITIFLFFYSFSIKKINPILISFLSLCSFLLLVYIFLVYNKIDLNIFLVQIFLFPQEISVDRFSSYNINLKNIFLDFKFIYFFLIPYLLITLREYFNKSLLKKDLNYSIILTFFSVSLIYHQIHTKNQIFIFFLIPILCAFLFNMLNNYKTKHYYYFIQFFMLACILITFKYHDRFNLDRKFHELSNTDISKGKPVIFKKEFFSGLKWITPKFQKPEEEIEIIQNFYKIIKRDTSKKMLITHYNFFSGLTSTNLYSPSRTYDKIAYPGISSKYFENYKNFFKSNIIRNKVKNIYVFEPGTNITEKDLSHKVFNYIPAECYDVIDIAPYLKKIGIQDCGYLKK